MEKLLAFLNDRAPADQAAFAQRCGTTVGYLRKAVSTGQRLGEGLCLRIGVESDGAVRPSDLRPEIDWQRLLGCQVGATTEPATAGAN